MFFVSISNLIISVMTLRLRKQCLLRSAYDELQEREGPDGDVGDAGAGQRPLQGVRPGGQRVRESAGHHEKVIN